MADAVRVVIEVGKKQKRAVAVAFDWPGWERSGKGEEDALRVLDVYRPRYRKVAELAGLGDAFDAAGDLVVVERFEGSGAADFMGISGSSASVEHEQMSDAECERKLALLQACWRYFDETWPRVSAELRKGPRGGGRDRDRVMQHTYGAETEYARKVGVRTALETLGTAEGRQAHREVFLQGIREVNAAGSQMKSSWTLQFTIRRACYHMLDHAWEMEDKDLTGAT